MKLLNNISTRYIVSLDIETVRIEENFENLSEDWQSAWEYKNKQGGEVPTYEELSDLWNKKAPLYAEFSKVCAVSLTFLDANEERLLCKEFYGEDEERLLRELKEFLDRISAKSKDFRLVGHGAKYFDYPFLCKRYVIKELDIPLILDTAHLKPWESMNLCTNADVWKMGGTGSGSSLQALCTALSLPISKVDLVGDEVGNAYFKGEYERIGRYCSLDTIATFNVIRKIKKEKIFKFEEVVYIDEPVEEKEITILERLFNTKQLNKDDLTKYLKDRGLNKKTPAKEKAELKKIVIAHYLEKIDIMDFEDVKKEKKATNEKRIEEINKLIDDITKKV